MADWLTFGGLGLAAMAATIGGARAVRLGRRIQRSYDLYADAAAAGPACDAPLPEGCELWLMLPCLGEQTVIVGTIEHLAPVCRRIGARIVVITGESESSRRRAAIDSLAASAWERRAATSDWTAAMIAPFPGQSLASLREAVEASTSASELGQRLQALAASLPTTMSVVDQWIDDHPDHGCVVRVHEPATTGTKATKLNFAVQQLRAQTRADPSRVYVAVYDADSRPSPATFCWIAHQLSEADAGGATSRPAMFQQVPSITGDKLCTLPPWGVAFCDTLLHGCRSLGMEVYWHTPAFDPRGALRYAMGAGLHLRLDVLDRAEGFPTCSDDIALGYRLELMGVERTFVPYPNIVEPVANARQLWNQRQRIYLGISAVFSEISRHCELHPAERARSRRRARWALAQIAPVMGRLLLFLLAAALVAPAAGLPGAVALLAVGYAFDSMLLFRSHRCLSDLRVLVGRAPLPKRSWSWAVTIGPLITHAFAAAGIGAFIVRWLLPATDRAAALELAGQSTDRTVA